MDLHSAGTLIMFLCFCVDTLCINKYVGFYAGSAEICLNHFELNCFFLVFTQPQRMITRDWPTFWVCAKGVFKFPFVLNNFPVRLSACAFVRISEAIAVGRCCVLPEWLSWAFAPVVFKHFVHMWGRMRLHSCIICWCASCVTCGCCVPLMFSIDYTLNVRI